MNILKILGRNRALLGDDIAKYENYLAKEVNRSRFLVIGGAGSIGRAVVKELFIRNPKALHVIDISENNLVELVRDIRSSLGYIDGDFQTLPLDCGSVEFEFFMNTQKKYDYIFNLSALKHVRSEKDPFTLMRLIDVNIINTIKTLEFAISKKTKKYFCVSTDKAANPVNMMGASKSIMEMFLIKYSKKINISTARFANVAFSDGSLLYGFNKRIEKQQPISAPRDVKRYFVTDTEAGQLCLLSGLLGENRDIFFPKLKEDLNLITFDKIAYKYLESLGYEPYICNSEDDARKTIKELIKKNKWPCYFFNSDTTGEKPFEEFFTENEILDLKSFIDIGVIKNKADYSSEKLEYFLNRIKDLQKLKKWSKEEIVDLFKEIIPSFHHEEKNKYLDSKM